MARILLIEDEKEIAKIMGVLLEFGDHVVLTAKDGEEGLLMAREASPDLIILDLFLPKMDGSTLNKHLLSDEKTRHIPVIVVTTQDASDNELSRARNVKLYLRKPFDVMDLLPNIRKVLDALH